MLAKRPTTLPCRLEVRRITGSGGAMLDTLATAVEKGPYRRPQTAQTPITRKPEKKILTVSLKINGLGSNNNRGCRHLRVIIIIF